MKFLIAFACLIAVACAVPLGDADAIIERSSSEINPDGSYSIDEKLSNGIQWQETGKLRDLPDQETGKLVPAIVASGEYIYTAPDGTQIKTSYIADENGFQPIGDHLPKN